MTANYIKKILFLFFVAAIIFVGLAPIAKADSLTLPTGDNALRSAVIDATGGYAYFGTKTSPAKILKIRLSDFSLADTLTLDINSVMSGVIDPVAGFAYFGNDDSVGKVVKINLSTFTEVASTTLGIGEGSLRRAAIDTVHGFLYFGTYTSPGSKVIKIDLSTFTKVNSIALASPDDNLNAIAIDTTNGFLYFGTDHTTTKIIKIDLSTFTEVATTTLPASERFLSSAVIDVARGFVYFGSTVVTPTLISKINLSTFTEVATLSTDSTLSNLSSAAIDTSGGYAYFAGYGPSLTKMISVDLSTFTIVGSTTLSASATQYPKSAAIDTSGGFVYFGTDTVPGVVYKAAILDGTPPTPGTVSFSDVTTTSITATTTGASDNVALATLPFRYHNVTLDTYSEATSSAVIFTDLTPDTSYTFEVGVEDSSGHWATSTPYVVTTLAVSSGSTLPTTASVVTSHGSHGGFRVMTYQPVPFVSSPITSPVIAPSVKSPSTTFTINRSIGNTGSDIKALQIYLNTNGYVVAVFGAGSPGYETTYFGPATKAALIRFQEANGIFPATGDFGPRTRALLNSNSLPLTTVAPTTQSPSTSFTRNLEKNMTGEDVKLLQIYLNTHGFTVANTGAGSPSHETNYFGPATKAALIRFQKANGIFPAVGYFGPITRGYMNVL